MRRGVDEPRAQPRPRCLSAAATSCRDPSFTDSLESVRFFDLLFFTLFSLYKSAKTHTKIMRPRAWSESKDKKTWERLVDRGGSSSRTLFTAVP